MPPVTALALVARVRQLESVLREVDARMDISAVLPALPEQADPDVSGLVEALEWYSEQVLGCRKITSEGGWSRAALDRDGGTRARAALDAYRKQGGEV